MRIRKNPEERYRELVDIAKGLFLTTGYERTTVQDICEQAGVAKGTFFYYFATKEAVLRAIFTEWAEQFAASYQTKADEISAMNQLRMLLALMSRENSIDPLVDKLFDEQQRDLAVDLWQSAVVERFNPLLRNILLKGVDEGVFSSDHMEERLTFFWHLLDAMWPDECRGESDEAADIRMGIAVPLIEQLFGAEEGSLQGFLGGDRK
ncbi:TetR/AcrR family transcriptional regulator [Selenomonas montiformis]|uniref:TetR/AcrR family transcriptional regulator n=1 Tax=Selenomonas montiformis TaxID=2652285 RepID=UPI0039F479BE